MASAADYIEVDGLRVGPHMWRALREERDELLVKLAKAQALADAQQVDHSSHVGANGGSCDAAEMNKPTWRHKWARDLHAILMDA